MSPFSSIVLFMDTMIRTTHCGALRGTDADQEATLNGWIHRIRNHGGISFISLRDRYGITQVVVDEGSPESLSALAEGLKMEYCIAVRGQVRRRPDDMINKDMSTGEIELVAEEITVLSKAPVLPFTIDEENQATENTRLEYRFLDLRSPGIQNRLILRHKVAQATRNYLNGRDFLEIETPTLIKSTPEGARDYLVPSRVNPGKFYALPQSPQLYKQLTMVAGLDKYYQIARCYRDEDPRGDRQPEFTQVDIEMSFVSRDDVLSMTEGLMTHIFRETLNIPLPTPFPRISYQEAMDRYGSDKPDLRFDLSFQDFTPFVPASEFGAFKGVVEGGGVVKALVVPGAAEKASRKIIGGWEQVAKDHGAFGLAWMKVGTDGLEGGISKFFKEQETAILEALKAEVGDIILYIASDWKTAVTALGAVRSHLGKELDLMKKDEFNFAWVVDFPLFEYNDEEKVWEPAHHMFSMPQSQYLESMEEAPGEVKGDLYDLVLNGVELGLRFHQDSRSGAPAEGLQHRWIP
jgi:aspartyl-tRNA synthetase